MKQFMYALSSVLMLISCISCTNQNLTSDEAEPVAPEYIVLADSEYSVDYCVSDAGIELIKTLEGFSATPYWDVNAHSIGYGHHGTLSSLPKRITKEEAEEFMHEDLEWVNNYLYEIFYLKFPYKWPQSVIDAYGSVIYNMGWTKFVKTRLYYRLKNVHCDKNGNIRRMDLDSILGDDLRDHWNETISPRRLKEYKHAVNGYHDLNRIVNTAKKTVE